MCSDFGEVGFSQIPALAPIHRSARRFPGRIGGILLAAVLLISCLAGQLARAAGVESIVIGVGRDFYEGPDSRTFLHGSTNTWEALTYLDGNMEPVPWLAESWTGSPDGLEWTFRLREEVRFHDGSPLTAVAVAASVDRFRLHPRYDPTGSYRDVVSVTAGPDRSVVFRLRAPSPRFPALVAYYGSPVIAPSGIDPDGRITEFIATGPYRPASIVPGEAVHLAAFEKYWGKPAAHDRVTFRMVPDAQTRIMALMAGDIDAVADVGGILPEQTDLLRDRSDIRLAWVETATTHMMVFNCGKPPFSDVEARKWLASVLDRNRLITLLVGEAGRAASDPYTRRCAAYVFGLIHPETETAPDSVPDSLKAHDGDVSILLHGGTLQRWPYLDMAQVLQRTLLRHGVTARIDTREAGGFHEAMKSGEFHLAIQPYTLMTGDPDFFYAYFIASEAPRNTGYRDAEADRLVTEARRETDPWRRKEQYRRLSEILARDLPVLPLYDDVTPYAFRLRIGSLEMDHWFRPMLTKGTSWR